MASALIVYGGWDGHHPKECAAAVRGFLASKGWTVTLADKLEVFKEHPDLGSLDLIVPIWTMGRMPEGAFGPLEKAVIAGTGVAGFHGGMGDAFRELCEWQLMVGGQFVAHPGNAVKYPMYIKDPTHPITAGVRDFEIESEQYYMHVDPSNRVLATTVFPTPKGDGPHTANGFFEAPQIWTRMHGKGRIFYSALGHDATVLTSEPHWTIMQRGLLWAADGKGSSAHKTPF